MATRRLQTRRAKMRRLQATRKMQRPRPRSWRSAQRQTTQQTAQRMAVVAPRANRCVLASPLFSAVFRVYSTSAACVRLLMQLMYTCTARYPTPLAHLTSLPYPLSPPSPLPQLSHTPSRNTRLTVDISKNKAFEGMNLDEDEHAKVSDRGNSQSAFILSLMPLVAPSPPVPSSTLLSLCLSLPCFLVPAFSPSSHPAPLCSSFAPSLPLTHRLTPALPLARPLPLISPLLSLSLFLLPVCFLPRPSHLVIFFLPPLSRRNQRPRRCLKRPRAPSIVRSGRR